MPLAPYTRIGPYQVIASLGAGGMGEVHRARDTRLSRDVALKVWPAPPQQLFDAGTPASNPLLPHWHYEVSADGKLFLTVTRRAEGAVDTPVTEVVNWLAGMKK